MSKKAAKSGPAASDDADIDSLDRVELDALQKVFERLDRKSDNKIDKEEVMQQFDELGYKPRKVTDYGNSEVEDIIWEVDEDSDGAIDWENFVQIYIRCRRDKTGHEPKRLYNLIEFMIHDKDGSGSVNEDECMEILYHRYGKEMMQQMTDDIFKNDKDGDNLISFQEFLTIVGAKGKVSDSSPIPRAMPSSKLKTPRR